MKPMVKILSYYFPIEQVQNLTIREAEYAAIRLALRASKGKQASPSQKRFH
ncbi:MAG: hypothetical protein HQL01_15110 [Nitrospirae bacterium]|nr:hypothetical protein [Nitrospirota bacterium]